MSWFNTNKQPNPTQLLSHLTPRGMEERIRKTGLRPFMGWGKAILKGKASHAHKESVELICHFPWAGCVQSSPGKQDSTTYNVDLGWQTCPTPSLLPLLALHAEYDTIWCGIPLGSAGVSCPSCVPSQFPSGRHSQPPRWWGAVRSRKDLGSM